MIASLYKPNQIITTTDISGIQHGNENKLYVDTTSSKIHFFKDGAFTDMF